MTAFKVVPALRDMTGTYKWNKIDARVKLPDPALTATYLSDDYNGQALLDVFIKAQARIQIANERHDWKLFTDVSWYFSRETGHNF